MTRPCLWCIARMYGFLVFWKGESACQLAVLLPGAPSSPSDASPASRAGRGRGALTGPRESLAEAGKQDLRKGSRLCATQDKKDSYQPVCNIPVITSLKEEEKLIESSTKVLGLCRTSEGCRQGFWDLSRTSRCPLSQPVVKLLYNRSNNKYSYTR